MFIVDRDLYIKTMGNFFSDQSKFQQTKVKDFLDLWKNYKF